MSVVFTVDPRSGVPVYLQLKEQIKRAVALGSLSPGEQLPTVKQLAVDLTLNPNTIARVYRELEHDEVIATSPGKGSFVRSNGQPATLRKNLDSVASRSLNESVREAKAIGLDRKDLRNLFERVLDRWYPQTKEGRQ
ncbi:MAG: GntR family transcriptional regulator [Candidatus Eremiobacteraeota bacterium]|nr:GntR family transcriptional regulator [Candidatus Eremiobacteraeota bacterium]